MQAHVLRALAQSERPRRFEGIGPVSYGKFGDGIRSRGVVGVALVIIALPIRRAMPEGRFHLAGKLRHPLYVATRPDLLLPLLGLECEGAAVSASQNRIEKCLLRRRYAGAKGLKAMRRVRTGRLENRQISVAPSR